jgi:hypothetical protein
VCARAVSVLHLAETHPQRPGRHRPVGLGEQPLLGERAERGLPQQEVGPLPRGRPLDLVDHRDAARPHPRLQRVDVEHPRRQVVEVGRPDAPDVRGDR